MHYLLSASPPHIPQSAAMTAKTVFSVEFFVVKTQLYIYYLLRGTLNENGIEDLDFYVQNSQTLNVQIGNLEV